MYSLSKTYITSCYISHYLVTVMYEPEIFCLCNRKNGIYLVNLGTFLIHIIFLLCWYDCSKFYIMKQIVKNGQILSKIDIYYPSACLKFYYFLTRTNKYLFSSIFLLNYCVIIRNLCTACQKRTWYHVIYHHSVVQNWHFLFILLQKLHLFGEIAWLLCQKIIFLWIVVQNLI